MRFIVKNTTLPNPLDLLSPHSCRGCGRTGEPLCECCKNNILTCKIDVCPNCKKPIRILKTKNPKTLKNYKCPHCKLPPIIVISERNSLVGTLIHDFKYNSARAIAKNLAELIAETLPSLENEKVILVPLPTASHHIRARAFDHTYLIAKHLARIKGFKVEKLLLRAKNTVQVGTDEKTREEQAKTAYEVNQKLKVDKTALYLLLDDVWTTGASMKSAIEKLRRSGVRNLASIILAANRLD